MNDSLAVLAAVAARFAGLSVEYRRDWKHYRKWAGPWRARLITNKNEREQYRLSAFGDSLPATVEALEQAIKIAELK